MKTERIRVLLVEDDPIDTKWVKRTLSKSASSHLSFDTEVVGSLSDAIKRQRDGQFDVVLLDLGLPDSRGLETLRAFHSENQNVPTVVLTGLSDEEVGVQAMQEGAQDYLPKEQYTPEILARAIRYAIERQNEINMRKRAEEELEKKKDMLEARSKMRSILTNAIPVLLTGAPPAVESLFINQMCNSVEDVLWTGRLAGVEEVDMETFGVVLCGIMNELGGDFEVEGVNERECVARGNACPWGLQAQRNRVLCMLTRAIFSQLAVKAFGEVSVNLDKTIGNGDDCCIVRTLRIYEESG